MCFGGGGGNNSPQPTPAPAPPPPSPIADESPLAKARKAEDSANYGGATPTLRVDRSATSGGIGSGGAGLRM